MAYTDRLGGPYFTDVLHTPLPDVVPQEPSAEVLDAVRAYVAWRREIGADIEPDLYRVEANLRRRYGITAPVEQIAGALQQL